MQDKSERSYHHGDLRRAVLDTAMDMLVQDGNWQFTLREVARRAGVSHAAPYKHFADKTALLTELALMGFERLEQALRLAATGGDGGIGGAFAAMARAYLGFGLANPALYRLMFGAEVARANGLHREPRAMAAFDLLGDLLRRGQAAGRIIAGPVPGLAGACWAQLHGLTMLEMDGLLRPEKVGEDAVEVALATFLNGVLIQGAGTGPGLGMGAA